VAMFHRLLGLYHIIGLESLRQGDENPACIWTRKSDNDDRK